MGYRHHLSRGFGHPFTREAGWDLLEVEADSESELSAYIAAAAKKFWKVWIRDGTGSCRAALYKPAKASQEWEDKPGSTPIARMVADANMFAVEFHVDLVLASLNHHVRLASSADDLRLRVASVIEAYGTSGKAVADAAKGLVGAVPRLNECMCELSRLLNDSTWRADAHRSIEAMHAATLLELSTLADSSSHNERPQSRHRPPRRGP
jgi:hypothetical protein